MQETNAAFLLSALQPEAGVCSLALPSDRQLDERGREAAEAQRLRSARVQEQVRIRMMLRGQAPARPEDLADGTRGGRPPGSPWEHVVGRGVGTPRSELGSGGTLAAGWGVPPTLTESPQCPRASPALGPGVAQPQRGLVLPHSGSCLSSPTCPWRPLGCWGPTLRFGLAGGRIFPPWQSPPSPERRRWLGSSSSI